MFDKKASSSQWKKKSSISNEYPQWCFEPRIHHFSELRPIMRTAIDDQPTEQIKGVIRFTFSGHDDWIHTSKWRHQMEALRITRYWPFVRGIHRSPVNSPHKGQWRRALMFSLISAWINGWINNRKVGDSRRHHSHYHFTVMYVPGINLGMGSANEIRHYNVVSHWLSP